MMLFRQTTALIAMASLVASFAPSSNMPRRRASSAGSLGMAKKLRNKQAELMKKMSEAKKEKEDPKAVETSGATMKLTNEEMKEANDRRRFAELLKTSAVSMNDVASNGYLSREQEEAEIAAYRKLKQFRVGVFD
jgi:hypothetical protein